MNISTLFLAKTYEITAGSNSDAYTALIIVDNFGDYLNIGEVYSDEVLNGTADSGLPTNPFGVNSTTFQNIGNSPFPTLYYD